MKRISLFLTGQQIKQLEKLSEKTGLAAAEHIRRAIDNYLEKVAKAR